MAIAYLFNGTKFLFFVQFAVSVAPLLILSLSESLSFALVLSLSGSDPFSLSLTISLGSLGAEEELNEKENGEESQLICQRKNIKDGRSVRANIIYQL
jgi:hypothetical protein